jgi:hypothetical protein
MMEAVSTPLSRPVKEIAPLVELELAVVLVPEVVLESKLLLVLEPTPRVDMDCLPSEGKFGEKSVGARAGGTLRFTPR